MVTKLANYDAPCVVLGKDRLWWIFLLSSLCTPFILAALTMIIRLMIRIHHNRKFFVDRNAKIDKTTTFTYFYEEFEVEWVTAIRDAADTLVSTRFRAGQIMAITSFVLSMCSLIIYYNTVSFFIKDVEQCQLFTNNVHQQADFAFNVFFLLYYLLRFAAAEEKITFLFNIWSIVDYFTVPPAFVGLALDRDWIGLKFLRVLYLRRIPNILWALGVMNSPAKIKLTQLGLTWIAILLAAGGMFHLVENSGDPFYPDYDGQRVTYWDFCYFAFGTMATLGSADINVKTILGKLTNVFLVFIVLMLIAFAVPEVLDLLGEREKHNGYHRKVHNEKHVVICGYITFDSVAEVFAEFFHPDRDIRDIKLICLDEGRPSMDFEAFLKKYKFQVGYLRGHIMNPTDLHRAKVHEADACLILANKTTNNAETEDTNNIMRVVALKNYHPKLRIIVQLLQYRSKSYLTSIPNWDPSVGDDVICLPEIKLGLLAQNCVAPGFATMMANIFAARASNLSDALPDWLNQYLSGAGMEMYPQTLSDTFSGLKFHELVEICYEKLNLLLLAVSNVPDENSSFFSLQFILNPPVGFRIQKGMTGCFIAESVNDAQRVSYYCRFCHDDIKTPDLIKPCECEGK
ncbi:Calcium-activated potassium channel slowpoke [Hypsibius exemplaris]|uniref:BK channel n=1 Tax=Hypsibius exemplaris TaxID=2072580 RepID=A0A1W0X0J5_HYPEX|nr:Calcium-activated potassium channel slowpoke [Hypsibius exemplaris]